MTNKIREVYHGNGSLILYPLDHGIATYHNTMEAEESNYNADHDAEELYEGVHVIENLSNKGLISIEEGHRRKFLIRTFFEYNSADTQPEKIDISCWKFLHHWWAKLWEWIYYAEEVD